MCKSIKAKWRKSVVSIKHCVGLQYFNTEKTNYLDEEKNMTDCAWD